MNMTFLVATKRQLLKGAAVLLTLLVLLALGSPTAAFAEDRGNQRPEGSWLYTVSIPTGGDPFVFLGTETYSAGGGYSEADQLSFMPGSLATAGHGEWKSIGKDRFLLTYVNLTYDGGNATGSSKVRQTTKLVRQLLQRFRRFLLLRSEWECSRLGHLHHYRQTDSRGSTAELTPSTLTLEGAPSKLRLGGVFHWMDEDQESRSSGD